MKKQWLQEAITNNAVWCNAIAQSHGIATDWREGIWFSEQPMPPLYPNLITLHNDASVDEHISAIESVVPVGWGIKDSYKTLALSHRDNWTPLNFQLRPKLIREHRSWHSQLVSLVGFWRNYANDASILR